ncbi:UvrD-helicase domain-containing protein [Candidatus Microgenomates bacterium]|nr:UvrD-helicase domain-containing protein [Candidatus Microgenomates bacterium]
MSNILTNLNPPQQEAVKYDKGPLLILAGAGSGKTRVLTHRAAWLIAEEGVAPENILLQTFTNKAANEMKERIVKLVGSSATPLASTFHSFCARVLRRDGKFLGLSPSFIIYDDADTRDALKAILTPLGLISRANSFANGISAAKTEMLTPQEYADIAYGHWQTQVAEVYASYQKYLEEANAVDFDDLLLYTVKLFQEFPEVLAKYTNQFRYILVDEWQDTNVAQYKLTKLLVGKNNNLTCVGDAAQSIYSWRGANHKNLDNLMQDFPGIKVINLEQNYRSTQTILDSAYNVISRNKSHPILKLWTQNGIGEKIEIYQGTNEMEEAAFVVSTIENLKLKGPTVGYNDFAILYRTNAQSRVIEETLLHAGIPYVLVGGTRFYERREIKDVLAYLRIIANPKDKVSIKRVEKIGKTRYKRFDEFANSIRINSKNIRNDSHMASTLELLDKILEVTKYLELYTQEEEEDRARLENIKELRSVAAEFSELNEFLEQIALVESSQNSKGTLSFSFTNSPGAITLMTAHAAKGLEFSVVFIVGLEEGIFPHARSLDIEQELEEERRLMYVGMTRAKIKLYLTFCTRRMLFGQRTNNLPSRFLMDIPKELSSEEVVVSDTNSWL